MVRARTQDLTTYNGVRSLHEACNADSQSANPRVHSHDTGVQ